MKRHVPARANSRQSIESSTNRVIDAISASGSGTESQFPALPPASLMTPFFASQSNIVFSASGQAVGGLW